MKDAKPILRLYRFRELFTEHILADDKPDPDHTRCSTNKFYIYDIYDSEYNLNPLTQPYYFKKIDYTLQKNEGGVSFANWVMANVDGNVRMGPEYKKNIRLYMPPKYYNEHLFAN